MAGAMTSRQVPPPTTRPIKADGGIDIQVLGIGSDGHIGFNEPGGTLASRTHVGVLTEHDPP